MSSPEKCVALLTDMDIDGFIHSGCLPLMISKVLSYGIIVGSLGVKIPQIIKLYSAKSSLGISVTSLAIESFGFLIVSSYFYRQHFALSTYAESFIIFVQNMVILSLVFKYNEQTVHGLLLIFAYFVLFAVTISEYFPFSILDAIYASLVLLIFLSRIPQIWTIYKLGTTGSLSFISRCLRFAGNAARLFTTIQEVDNVKALLIILSSFVLNGIIVVQFFIYWKADSNKKKL